MPGHHFMSQFEVFSIQCNLPVYYHYLPVYSVGRRKEGTNICPNTLVPHVLTQCTRSPE